MAQAMAENVPGMLGAGGGWLSGLVRNVILGSKGGIAFVGVIGWESIHHHVKWRASEWSYRNMLHLFRNGDTAVDTWHYRHVWVKG